MSRNRLGGETSPYLLQHSDNPVHWWPWSAAALAEAEATGKPILLSIGYAACHWCHVMAHESFEDDEVAEAMNRLFVNIKVDREERPDIDQIYMSALHAMGEPGGWPLTMFLTPKGEPVWGGTYFPKTPQYGRPGFLQVMHAIARVFREEPERIERNRAALLDTLRKPDEPTHAVPPDIVPQAAAKLLGLMDPVHGGTHGAPKFPNAGLLELLWRAGRHDDDDRYRDAVTKALDGMALGGIYDHLAGGFARYSVDEQWLAPHFEKMLSDNGLLLSLYAHAAAATGSTLYQQRIEQTVGWLTSEMQTDGGGFAASLDADSEGSEGKYYVWSEAEIRDVLDTREFEAFAPTYDVQPGGNWEGVTILNRLKSDPSPDPPELEAARAKLLARRSERVRPGLDDKILADWNGYAIRGMAEAARVLDRPPWLAAAERAYRFIEATHGHGDRLCHAWRAGAETFPGFASDYASMIAAALSLHETTRSGAYLGDAVRWTRALDTHHWDEESGGYFLAADDADDLIVRMKMPYDEAAPNANGLMAQNLARLWCFTGEAAYRERGEALVAAFSQPILQNVFGAASLLSGFDMLTRLDHAVVVVPAGEMPDELLAALYGRGDPGLSVIVAEAGADFPAGHPASGKAPIDSRPTAYLCSGMRCSAPVTEANRLTA